MICIRLSSLSTCITHPIAKFSCRPVTLLMTGHKKHLGQSKARASPRHHLCQRTAGEGSCLPLSSCRERLSKAADSFSTETPGQRIQGAAAPAAPVFLTAPSGMANTPAAHQLAPAPGQLYPRAAHPALQQAPSTSGCWEPPPRPGGEERTDAPPRAWVSKKQTQRLAPAQLEPPQCIILLSKQLAMDKVGF